MILVIKQGNGESWGDYHEHIAGVYKINKKGLKASDIEKAHNDFLTQLCEDIGLVVNPGLPHIIMHKSLQPEGKAPTRELKKAHRKILFENTFVNFIINKYNAKKLKDVQTITLF